MLGALFLCKILWGATTGAYGTCPSSAQKYLLAGGKPHPPRVQQVPRTSSAAVRSFRSLSQTFAPINWPFLPRENLPSDFVAHPSSRDRTALFVASTSGKLSLDGMSHPLQTGFSS